jgi:hypothetical protein
LQTSREIYNFFANGGGSTEERNLLIRVIVPSAMESRYRIIRATNSQTVITAASSRATDLIHRGIEEYLHTYGIYYDRRKNFYKNQGKSIRSIIGKGLSLCVRGGKMLWARVRCVRTDDEHDPPR